MDKAVYVLYNTVEEGFLILSQLENEQGEREFMFRGWGDTDNASQSVIMFETDLASINVAKMFGSFVELDEHMFLVPLNDREFDFGMSVNLMELMEETDG